MVPVVDAAAGPRGPAAVAVRGAVVASDGALEVGFGRIVASEIEVPNLLVDLVRSGCTRVQSDNAGEPYLEPVARGPAV